MIFGLDYLAGAKYPDVILKEHPQGWAAGFFLDVDGFGDASDIIQKLAKTGRCPHFRIHLMWKDDHRFSEKDLPELIKRAKKVQAIADKFPHIRFEISPMCEHELNAGTSDKINAEIKKAAPRCRIVNSYFGKGQASRVFKNEIHGSKSKKPNGIFNFSFDGESQVDSDVETHKQTYGSAEVFFMWDPQFNLRKETNDKTPRAERRVRPSSNLIDSLIYQAKSSMPEWISKKFPPGFLYKSHSDFAFGDPQNDKPIILHTANEKEILGTLANGQVVATFKNVGKYKETKEGSGQRWKYECQEYGYLVAEKAKRISGGPHFKLICGPKHIATINPAFRAGFFQKPV